MHEQRMALEDGGTYSIQDLIYYARDLPEFDLPLIHMNFCDDIIKGEKMRDFVASMRQVLEADLSYPILLGQAR